MTEQPYEIVLTPPARRAIAEELPEAVAAAAIDFVTTALLDNPQRVGKPLRDDLAEAEGLPDDTRLWAMLQSLGGGAWGGCVYDTEKIIAAIEAGERALAESENQ